MWPAAGFAEAPRWRFRVLQVVERTGAQGNLCKNGAQILAEYKDFQIHSFYSHKAYSRSMI